MRHALHAAVLVALALAATAAFALPQDYTPGPVPTPPAPPPPPLADDPVIRAAIGRADHCLNVDGGRSAAMLAVAESTAPLGSPQWYAVRDVVMAYVVARQAQKQCIIDLDKLRFETVIPKHDRTILITRERGMIAFWLRQSPYEAAMLAHLIDSRSRIDGGNLPYAGD